MEMKTKHTPGPWEWDAPVWGYDPQQQTPWLVCSTKGTIILSGSIQCTGEADALLIAAAPMLLSALQFLVECSAPMTSQQEQCWISINAAIAAATGEQA